MTNELRLSFVAYGWPGTVEYHTTFFNPEEHKMARLRCVQACAVLAHLLCRRLQVFDLFTVPSYNGYMAAAYKNYTIEWTPKVDTSPWDRHSCL